MVVEAVCRGLPTTEPLRSSRGPAVVKPGSVHCHLLVLLLWFACGPQPLLHSDAFGIFTIYLFFCSALPASLHGSKVMGLEIDTLDPLPF